MNFIPHALTRTAFAVMFLHPPRRWQGPMYTWAAHSLKLSRKPWLSPPTIDRLHSLLALPGKPRQPATPRATIGP